MFRQPVLTIIISLETVITSQVLLLQQTVLNGNTRGRWQKNKAAAVLKHGTNRNGWIHPVANNITGISPVYEGLLKFLPY